MKTKIQVLTMVICLITVSSCSKKSEDPAPETPPASGSFTCNLSGTSWSADSAVYINNGTQTFIMAYKAGRMEFEINLSGITATTYPVGSGSNDFIYWPTLTSFSGGSGGSVVISTYDNSANQIIGTFGPTNTSGPGGTFSITEGTFTKLPMRS